jgi:predicted nuclease of predicted toxin-antitoxin system
MWLLDVNLPNGLRRVLEKLGQASETTAFRGWRDLGNGVLADAAYNAGFRAILTRDRLFGESAGRALQSHPDLAVVILKIAQSREAAYLVEFEKQWATRPIHPVPGQVTEWPE